MSRYGRSLTSLDDARETDRRDPMAGLRAYFGQGYEIMAPGDAEEPILAPNVRVALFAWLAEIRAADELKAVGLKPRSTALFYGPPGCGKTTMAHHLAARLGLPLLVVGSENIISSGWGEAEQALTKLFAKLKAAPSPVVAFIDEIEGIGGSRDKNTHGGADNARTSLLGVMLRKIETYEGFFIGATNRPDDIDQALWRRFHLQVSIDLPGGEERFAIIRRYGLPFQFTDDDVDLLTDLTEGASPALLRGVMEGVKRALVIGARIGIDITDPVRVFSRVLTSVKPPPEIENPPLWHSAEAVCALSWPPAREAA